MLNNIKSFFEKNFMPTDGVPDNDHQLKLATAALLIEMMMQDDEVHDAERKAVQRALEDKFQLSASETSDLYKLAEQEVKASTDYHQFTSLMAQYFTQPQKVKVIEYLWLVAYADKHLDRYEEHMVRRIADLIHVSHKDFIQTKHLVKQQLGLE
jgi:uncharacterized tellurite resistance protein B-like protein